MNSTIESLALILPVMGTRVINIFTNAL